VTVVVLARSESLGEFWVLLIAIVSVVAALFVVAGRLAEVEQQGFEPDPDRPGWYVKKTERNP
jgi:hypothetical protein